MTDVQYLIIFQTCIDFPLIYQPSQFFKTIPPQAMTKKTIPIQSVNVSTTASTSALTDLAQTQRTVIEFPKKDSPLSETYTVHTSCIFDSLLKKFLPNVSLTISRKTGLITKVHHRPSLDPSSCPHPAASEDLDLTSLPLVIPGLVDLHTHIFLHPYASAASQVQETQESPVERILRATVNLRAALKAGFTTYRELGTEGCFTADIDVRNAVNRGIIPGPRLFVVGEAIAASGEYAVRSENDASASLGAPYGGLGAGFSLATTNLGRLSDQADGVDGVRTAVRRRLGTGADLVKVYADYRSRALRWPASNVVSRPNDPQREIQFPPTNQFVRNPSISPWTQEELSALVSQARAMGSTVAAHAVSARAASMAITAGVTTIEHAWEEEDAESVWNPFSTPLPTDHVLKQMAHRHTIWHPTLYILEGDLPPALFDIACSRVRRAYNLGVHIGVGSDTGGVRHGGQAREIELLVTKCHLPLEYALRAATLGGWEGIWGREVLLSNDKEPDSSVTVLGPIIGQADLHTEGGNHWSGEEILRFGALREGWAADLVALGGDVREDLAAIGDVIIVIKDGKVVVANGGIVE